MTNPSLSDLKGRFELILVLAINRKRGKRQEIIGVPHGSTVLKAGDEMMCYGHRE